MDWKFLFFTSDGRISRQQFWIGALILIGAGVVAGWIPLINIIAWFVSLYAWVCLYSKRLHDMGRSGWLTALPVALFVAAGAFALLTMGGLAATGAFNTGYMHDGAYMGGGYMHPGAMMGMGVSMALFSLVGLIALLFMLWVGLTPGQAGDNQYGAPPSPDPIPEPKSDAPQG
ncbi:MAG TPA: DUF805 domain-containing protein [Caulobacteraceae bacterium]